MEDKPLTSDGTKVPVEGKHYTHLIIDDAPIAKPAEVPLTDEQVQKMGEAFKVLAESRAKAVAELDANLFQAGRSGRKLRRARKAILGSAKPAKKKTGKHITLAAKRRHGAIIGRVALGGTDASRYPIVGVDYTDTVGVDGEVIRR